MTMTQHSTTDSPGNNPLLLDRTNLINQASLGPTLREVGSIILHDRLKQAYPLLDINPDRTQLVTPHWHEENDIFIPSAPHVESLTHALLSLARNNRNADFIEGQHYLTVAPLSSYSVHLAVKIEEIALLLNECASMLYIEFQQCTLDYWNQIINGQPRWQGLSVMLAQALNVEQAQGWDADQCAIAKAVANAPDKQERSQDQSAIPNIKACLIDVDFNETNNVSHLMLGAAIVLHVHYKKREQVLLYTLDDGYEAFESLEKLGDTLPRRLGEHLNGRAVIWQLFEPDGNIFDYIAFAMINNQIDAIDDLKPSVPGQEPVSHLLREPLIEEHFSPQEKDHIARLQAAIPAWLSNASADDLNMYSHCLSGLGDMRNTLGSNDIAPIGAYAQAKMIEAIRADRKDQETDSLPLDDLQITVTDSLNVGSFILPNYQTQKIETLGDFALQNVAPYMGSLQFKNNTAVPAWLTINYLTSMAAQVDIGKIYPQMLSEKLISDPVQVEWQKRCYVNVLPHLLRLQALECKLQGECGVDEMGYQAICTLMDIATGKAPGNPHDIILRPLTLMPSHRLLSSADAVTHMYLIGPRLASSGPCLLLRPLLDPPLLQFPSEQNLLYALQQPGDLRDSVLAWLPSPAVSFEYAQYVFPVGLPSPWLAAQSGVQILSDLEMAGPIKLVGNAITNDLLGTLFNSNATTLAEQADRQSLSNGERRWEILKDSGWAIFNIASSFLTGPVGTAVWVWQIITEIQQGLDGRQRGDSLVSWNSFGDVLMTLGIVLTHHAYWRRQGRKSPRTPKVPLAHPPESPEPPKVPVKISLAATARTGELPFSHFTSLQPDLAVPRRSRASLGAFLDTLKVDAPPLTSEQLNTPNSTPPHYYEVDSNRYVKVSERWFPIVVEGNEFYIYNPRALSLTGPRLFHDQQGQWFIDVRLRLRGGMPRSRLLVIREAREIRKRELDELLKAFKALEPTRDAQFRKLHGAFEKASDTTRESLTNRYTQMLQELITGHTEYLNQLQERRAIDPTFEKLSDLLHYTTLCEMYLSSWFVFKANQYALLSSKLKEQAPFDSSGPAPDNGTAIREVIDLGNSVVEHLELAQKNLTRLEGQEKGGDVTAKKLGGLQPKFTRLDFKANEIGMSYGFCIQEKIDDQMPFAREAIIDLISDAAATSHELSALLKKMKLKQLPSEDAIHLLSGLKERYGDVRARIRDLPTQYPGMLQVSGLDGLQGLLDEFENLTRTHLDRLLPETDLPLVRPAPFPLAGSSRPKVKVIKSRPGSTQPTPATAAAAQDIELKKYVPTRATGAKLDDWATVSAALNLNLDVNAFIQRTVQDSLKPSRIPADMQDLFEQRALKLDAMATALEMAMSNIRQKEGSPPPVGSIPLELRDAAIRTRSEGVRARTNMLRKRRPRQEYFQWLHANGQVRIVRNEQGRIRTVKRKDYFEEYRILDLSHDNEELWVAHFHYDTPQGNAERPTAAHLKVSNKYLATLEPGTRQSLDTLEPLDYVLRRLTSPATLALFLAV
jgi:hypothetical protein